MGGLMDPFELDLKSGLPVHEALAAKHPNLLVPRIEDENYIGFEDHPSVPSMVPLTVSDNVMTKTARRLKGGAGPGGVDSYLFKDMHLWFGRASILFREEMGAWIN